MKKIDDPTIDKPLPPVQTTVTPLPGPPVEPETKNSNKTLWVVVGVIVVIAAIALFSSKSTADVVKPADIKTCESFWKEPCSMVAVPESIKPNFSQSYYADHTNGKTN